MPAFSRKILFPQTNQRPNRRHPKDSLTELFCQIDGFCRQFEPAWERRRLAAGVKKRKRNADLSLSELMTLAILFHQLRFRQSGASTCATPAATCAVNPQAAQLQPLRRASAALRRPPRRPVRGTQRRVRRRLHRRRDRAGRLRQPPHLPPPRLRGQGRARQDLHGRVLRLQAAPHRQLEGRVAERPADARQHRRPQARPGDVRGAVRPALASRATSPKTSPRRFRNKGLRSSPP